MAGVITTGSHPKALWPGVFAWFGKVYDEHPEEYVDLFDRYTSDKAYEEIVLSRGFGLVPQKAEGGSTTYDSDGQGYVTRATHVAYSMGYIVTREEMADNKYVEVSERRAGALAFSLRQTVENVAANVYNRAFDSNYIFGDGVELLATTHPSLAGTWSNELNPAADMSEASLEDLIIQIMGATNERGLKIGLKPDSLLVPRQLWFDANRILGSVLQNDTANNAVNVLRTTNSLPGGIKVNHYLTDQDAFFIRTRMPPRSGMMMFEREAMSFSQDSDFDTDNAKAKVYQRLSFTVPDPRALYGSAGA